jgi:hypothetical protein
VADSPAAAAAGAGSSAGQHSDSSSSMTPSDWGCQPEAVLGWGVEESTRQLVCRTRRSLLLYLKVRQGCCVAC